MTHEFKPFDKVLVRDEDEQYWDIGFFKEYNRDLHYITMNGSWKQCIAYEGNESLFKTVEEIMDEKEQFKFGDHVAVRDSSSGEWRPARFVCLDKVDAYPYIVLIKGHHAVTRWEQCKNFIG